jgi:opacity protein-like surface antigen
MRSLFVVAAVSLVMAATPASAEWFADIYAGYSLTESHDVFIKGRKAGEPVDGRLLDTDFQHSWAYGARLGHWFDTMRFIGLAADVLRFYPDIESQTVNSVGTLPEIFRVPAAGFAGPARIRGADIEVTAVSLDLMLRWPLMTSKDIPNGRLQPYLTAGPGLYITDVQSFNTDFAFGVKVGAGLLFMLSRDLGFFAEYRLTHFRPEVDSHRLRLRTTIDTQHILGGVTVRF